MDKEFEEWFETSYDEDRLDYYNCKAAWEESKKQNSSKAETLEVLLNPRQWTKEMHDAWHNNLPDTQAAFKALKDLK